MLTNQSGAESWPVTGASFIIVYRQPQNSAAVGDALKFFAWAYKSGQKMAEDLDYVPMPTNVVALVQKTWGEIKGADGKWTSRSLPPTSAAVLRLIDAWVSTRRRRAA